MCSTGHSNVTLFPRFLPVSLVATPLSLNVFLSCSRMGYVSKVAFCCVVSIDLRRVHPCLQAYLDQVRDTLGTTCVALRELRGELQRSTMRSHREFSAEVNTKISFVILQYLPEDTRSAWEDDDIECLYIESYEVWRDAANIQWTRLKSVEDSCRQMIAESCSRQVCS